MKNIKLHNLIFPILISSLLIASCTPLMMKYGGTYYGFNRHTSKAKIHEILGQPFSEQLFNPPLDVGDIPEHKYLKYVLPNKKIIASEVFKIKGRVRTSDEVEGADYLLIIDVFTLGAFEIVFFPLMVIDSIKDSKAEKKVTIWYNEDKECAFGEIDFMSENKSKVLISCYQYRE